MKNEVFFQVTKLNPKIIEEINSFLINDLRNDDPSSIYKNIERFILNESMAKLYDNFIELPDIQEAFYNLEPLDDSSFIIQSKKIGRIVLQYYGDSKFKFVKRIS